jgi:glycosyltransferase involved in cell wall biosynthesis
MFDFSVITPVYNGEKFLVETIKSVLSAANAFSVEYIVVNDGSTDNTSNLLSQFSKELVIVNQENAGEASAVNTGIEKSKGRYLIVLSSDDLLKSRDLFEHSKNIFSSNPHISVVYPDWQIIDSDGKVLEEKKVREYSFERLFAEFDCLPGPGAVFRRDFALQVGGRDTSFKFVSDYDFWLRMSQYGPFIRIPFVLAQWRKHENSTSIGSKGFAMGMERILVIKNFIRNFSQSSNVSKTALAHAYYNAAVFGFFSKEIPDKRWMVKSLISDNFKLKNGKYRIVFYILLMPFSTYILKLAQIIGLYTTENSKK